MRKSLICLALTMVLGSLNIIPAFAQENNIPTTNNVVLLNDVNQQLVTTKNPRGTIISTGILRISDEGNGEIGVYMETLTHQFVDETIFGIYLDRWIESEQSWQNVANYSFKYTKEDYPDENLSMKSVSFNIKGQPTDCYYRLRGMHLVVVGDTREMLSSKTDGLLISK